MTQKLQDEPPMTEKHATHMIALLREIRDRLTEQKEQHQELLNHISSTSSSANIPEIPCPAKY